MKNKAVFFKVVVKHIYHKEAISLFLWWKGSAEVGGNAEMRTVATSNL